VVESIKRIAYTLTQVLPTCYGRRVAGGSRHRDSLIVPLPTVLPH
jgi:hypothetical protein